MPWPPPVASRRVALVVYGLALMVYLMLTGMFTLAGLDSDLPGGSLDFPAGARPRAYTWLWTSRPMNEVGELRTVQLSGQPCYVVSELN